jgi:hypothetical protein
MLQEVDNLLRHLFIREIDSITDEDQVRFQPPDEDWRSFVASLGTRIALNVYLTDMRENRKLRTNERLRDVHDGIITETNAPRRVDCYYLLSAWSPMTIMAGTEPTLDEHQLLYKVIEVLMRQQSLIPREIYANAMPSGFHNEIADSELPITILPVDGFPKYAEFWGTMGSVHPWKPAIYLTVTIPVLMLQQVAGPLVTTRITEFRQTGNPETSEVWIQIGGTVLDQRQDPPSPIPYASVRLETESGNAAVAGEPLQAAETNALGRFTFSGLHAGRYRLRVRAPGLAEKVRLDVTVPSPTGEYDIVLP